MNCDFIKKKKKNEYKFEIFVSKHRRIITIKVFERKNDISIIIVFSSSQVNSNSRKMSELLFHKYSHFKANKILLKTCIL